ncbi:MAG: hypothetical protein CL912_27045 [Deltaproteobacteria bacterium]|nr:hypothetical protein [Deltaproteobacteria bacterium]
MGIELRCVGVCSYQKCGGKFLQLQQRQRRWERGGTRPNTSQSEIKPFTRSRFIRSIFQNRNYSRISYIQQFCVSLDSKAGLAAISLTAASDQADNHTSNASHAPDIERAII